MSRLEWFIAFLAVLAGFLLGLGIAAASGSTGCPPGHTIAIDRTPDNGFYYVFTPNLPAGYSRVITFNPDRVIDLPPPGTYQGDRIVVCYTEDIRAWAATVNTPTPEPTATSSPTTTTAPTVTPTISTSATASPAKPSSNTSASPNTPRWGNRLTIPI